MESKEKRDVPVLAVFLSLLYAAVPLFVLFLRPRWREIHAEIGMLDKLPLPSKLMLNMPISVFFVFCAGVIGLLLWAGFRGPRGLDAKLNVAGLVGLGLFVGMWLLGVFLPLIKIQEALESQ